jgi:hypothetical protein
VASVLEVNQVFIIAYYEIMDFSLIMQSMRPLESRVNLPDGNPEGPA